MKKLHLEYWKLELLKPYGLKLKTFTDDDVARMIGLIRTYGFRVPILINRHDGEVIDGDGLRLAAIQQIPQEELPELGLNRIPVVPIDDLAPDEIRGLRLGLKRSATWAEFDWEALGAEIEELDTLAVDLSFVFTEEELANLLDVELLEMVEPDGGDPEESSAPIPKLRFDGYSVPLTAEELAGLQAKAQAYLDQNGVLHGFASGVLLV